MQTKLNPYIAFKDNAREAMEFYQTVFGGNVELNTFKDGGMPHDPSEAEKIMHAKLESTNGFTLMAADTPSGMEYHQGANVSLSLNGDDEAELRGYWEKLLQSGTQTVPLEKAPWGDTFGMLTDQFGIAWLVNISGDKN